MTSLPRTVDPAALPSDRSTWPEAVVVGLALNGLALARVLHRRGIRVRIVAPQLGPMKMSRSIWRAEQLKAWNEDALMAALSNLGNRLEQPAVLIQTKDEGVRWTARHRETLARWFRVPLPTLDTVGAMMNKNEFYKLATAEGWPVPLTWSARSEEELRGLLGQIQFPCILKPQLKNSLFRLQTLPKAFKPKSETELFETYRSVAKFEPEVVISEWIEGSDEQVISCRGYWDQEGGPVLRFVSQKLMQWPAELGSMVAMGQAPLAWWPDCVALTDRIFRHTRMHGIGALECKRRPDGRLAIIEPTIGRTPMSHEIAPINGFDIPFACYCHAAFGLRVEEPIPLAPGIKLINPRGVRMAATQYRSQGLLSAGQIRDLMAGPSLKMVWRWNDPLPGLGTMLRNGVIGLRGAVRGWLKRIRRSTQAAPPDLGGA